MKLLFSTATLFHALGVVEANALRAFRDKEATFEGDTLKFSCNSEDLSDLEPGDVCYGPDPLKIGTEAPKTRVRWV